MRLMRCDLYKIRTYFAAMGTVFFTAFGGNSQAEVMDNSEASLPADVWDAAQQSVLYELRDPTSVLFRKLISLPQPEGDEKPRYVCGEFNGKNGFGAYAGFQPFLYTVNDGSIKLVRPEYFDGSAMGKLALLPLDFSGCLRHLEIQMPD